MEYYNPLKKKASDDQDVFGTGLAVWDDQKRHTSDPTAMPPYANAFQTGNLDRSCLLVRAEKFFSHFISFFKFCQVLREPDTRFGEPLGPKPPALEPFFLYCILQSAGGHLSRYLISACSFPGGVCRHRNEKSENIQARTLSGVTCAVCSQAGPLQLHTEEKGNCEAELDAAWGPPSTPRYR